MSQSDSSCSVGQSADLRTRIAAAISGVDDWQGVTDPAILADAVIRELLPTREGRWGWLDGTVSTNPATGNPIKLEIEPGEVIPLSVDDARDVALALLAAVTECGEDHPDGNPSCSFLGGR